MNGNFGTLAEMAQEVERIENTKNDYIVKGGALRMVEDRMLSIQNMDDMFVAGDYAHSQIATKLGIPKQYYDKMPAIEGLRTMNVNAWLHNNPDTPHFVRTLDGKARAFLSNTFRPIDHYDVLESVLPMMKELEVKVKSSSLSEKKLYLEVVFPSMEREVVVGDVVQHGFILSNSEIGHGAVDLKYLLWRLKCQNGMVGASIMRKYHLGSRLDVNQADIYKSDTVRAELDSFKLRLRDIMADAMSEARFTEQILKLRGAVEDKIENVTETVMNVTKRFGIAEKFNDKIITNMAEEGNMNRYGLANGITALAHVLDSVDAQYDVQKYGSAVIDMSRNEWGKYHVA